jgi:hypothetical protein
MVAFIESIAFPVLFGVQFLDVLAVMPVIGIHHLLHDRVTHDIT